MKKTVRNLFIWLFFAALATALTGLGIFDRLDYTLSDLWYQKSQATDGEIVIIGIDERALKDLGPFQTWGRETMAEVLEYLNQDEENRPAVIGIDILYSGETELEADQRLAAAAGIYQNVVAASSARFGTELKTEDNGVFYMEDFSVLDYDAPYEALLKSVETGHINAMYDSDGILRRGLMYVTLPDGSKVPSFAKAIADAYNRFNGQDLSAAPPTDSKGFWYLPFTGLPGDFYEDISVTDILNGDIPPEFFAGRIVLIGPYAPGLMDSYVTAIDHASPMYGVEYQANAIMSLLKEDFKQEAEEGWQLFLLFLTVFGCCVCFWNRKLIPATLAWALGTGGWLVLCRIFYLKGIVLHVSWVPVWTTVVYGGMMVANYGKAAMERRRVTAAFKRYVAPEIVNEILKEGTDALELGGRLCEITVLFVDIRGFTTMSEALEPTKVVEILNRYLTLTSSCVMGHGGTLDKFVGDCTMAIWGAPLPLEDPVMNAVKAALDMVEGSQRLSKELMSAFGRTVSFGIGIHMGPAVVGNIGAPNRMDYTAIGDTVNTAARLEANAPGGKIYISRAVADALKGRIRAVSLGDSIRLKGKAAGFEILSLEGLAPEEKRV